VLFAERSLADVFYGRLLMANAAKRFRHEASSYKLSSDL
jgi:hypothetical protein